MLVGEDKISASSFKQKKGQTNYS